MSTARPSSAVAPRALSASRQATSSAPQSWTPTWRGLVGGRARACRLCVWSSRALARGSCPRRRRCTRPTPRRARARPFGRLLRRRSISMRRSRNGCAGCVCSWNAVRERRCCRSSWRGSRVGGRLLWPPARRSWMRGWRPRSSLARGGPRPLWLCWLAGPSAWPAARAPRPPPSARPRRWRRSRSACGGPGSCGGRRPSRCGSSRRASRPGRRRARPRAWRPAAAASPRLG
mmetsp:Transcript_78695/g.218681  ORF Transcript_78695/g.218681 Transcript_78695/m.218681 type:complete len:232 (-) Transcript_78695:246-941(-)